MAGISSVTDLLQEGLDAQGITERLLSGLGVADSSFSLKPQYGPCEAEALKERMKRAVALLGEQEVQQVLKTEGKIEVMLLLLG